MSKFVSVEHRLFANSPFELVSLVDKGGSLTLQLEDKQECCVTILFDDYIYYDKMDEGDALRSLQLIKSASCIGKPLIQAEHSDLIDWIVEESLGIRSVEQLNHYVIVTSNDVVNVVAMSLPLISGTAS